ncbi:alkaline phosphatase D family protein [Hydrocarboniclastica marina]|uniref:Alkaline phosphatase family protein n=1 Tax=Hydrocarboniclastica marina TaxID=2259620 RepID=A0A4P7XIK7_9ALTE|nr:alkaline phosphatase D family protein [Hydrocarboniclastica marina]QCF26921.1 alkaline phosphatase family protein [Hydrocarboniclastica marina]
MRLQTLSPMLAGPILRHVTNRRITLWLMGSCSLVLRLRLFLGSSDEPWCERTLTEQEVTRLRFGTFACLHLIDVELEAPLPADTRIGYDLGVSGAGSAAQNADGETWVADWAPHLCMPGSCRPDFVLRPRVDRLVHGSCRRPHSPAPDGLARVDQLLLEAGAEADKRPAMLMLTGDQIYADDVAGPMLRAIHSLIERLGLYEESIPGGCVDDSRSLRQNPDTYFHREKLLPDVSSNEALLERFFGGVRKPVFTTASAHNHLIALNEIMAMYLLVWSPVCWELVSPEQPALGPEEATVYREQQIAIDGFVADLPRAARALAHLPTYMIFDDHDVTDDWNLSALWEATIYEHPFSRRIIGNALMAYMLCQGWGNNPDVFDEVVAAALDLTSSAEQDGVLDPARQDKLIDTLLNFQHWHYTLQTSPRIVVLDTRTRRWRSEVNRARPSGLLDWEALTEFQQEIIGEKAVIVVSPAPMFGVKLIETIQRLFTFFGKPLVVDAENWMAHRGAANVLLNIFSHSRTPETFVVLSGDVHYSFVYDVRFRRKPDRPRIWQITSSGIKNEFPHSLMEWLDRINRWLYAPWSPLNWFTKRRRMRITPREPEGREAGERLWNNAGIGMVELDGDGVPVNIQQLNSRTGGTRFRKPKG